MSSKKRKYTFGSGCENIPSKELCNQAGEYNGMGCAWKGGRCESDPPTEENFTQIQAQTHDGQSCKGGLCVRWWRAK